MSDRICARTCDHKTPAKPSHHNQYLFISPLAVSQLLKKLGCFSAADVTNYHAKVSHHDTKIR